MISVYVANARVIQIKINIEPSFTQRVRGLLACPKTPNVVSSLSHSFPGVVSSVTHLRARFSKQKSLTHMYRQYSALAVHQKSDKANNIRKDI